MFYPTTSAKFAKFVSSNEASLKSEVCESKRFIWMPFMLDLNTGAWVREAAIDDEEESFLPWALGKT